MPVGLETPVQACELLDRILVPGQRYLHGVPAELVEHYNDRRHTGRMGRARFSVASQTVLRTPRPATRVRRVDRLGGRMKEDALVA